jgi:hypothetical protein
VELYRRLPLVEWQASPGRIHVSPPTGEPHDLVGGAAMVWAVLDRPRSLRGIMAELSDLEPALDEGQVLGIIASMMSASLVAKYSDDVSKEIAV